MDYRSYLAHAKERAVEAYSKLTRRELIFVAAAAGTIIFLITFQAVSWAYSSFQAQQEELAQTERDLEQLEKRIVHLVKLKGRKERIEQEYQKADLQEGGLGYLDDLIQKKLGLSNVDFTLSDAPGQQLGEDHEQIPFSMTLRKVTSLEKLVDFLTELTRGPRPFIVTALTIEKRGTFVDVNINASAIRRIRE